MYFQDRDPDVIEHVEKMRELLHQVKRANTQLSINSIMNVGDYSEFYALYLSFGEVSQQLNLTAPIRLKPVYMCFQVK